jgi:hypothetical protein
MFEDSELHQLRRVVREEVAAIVGRPSASASLGDGGRPSLVSITQAAACAGVSERTLRAWMKAGKLKRHGQGRVALVDTQELKCFLSTPEAKPGEELSPESWVALKQQRRNKEQKNSEE